MSGYELLIDQVDGRLIAAVVKQGKVDDLYVDGLYRDEMWGAFFVGKVMKLDRSLDAAIVDLGHGITGYLPAKDVYFPGENSPGKSRTGITDLLDTGQTIMVQIKSEAKKESAHERHKHPRLTMKLAVIGQYLVYSPLAHQVTLSRAIKNEDILALTSKLGGKGGWIVQSKAERAKADQITAEEKALLNKWDEIYALFNTEDNTPRLIMKGPDVVSRSLNDYGSKLFDNIFVGNKDIMHRVMEWCGRHDPALASSKVLRMYKTDNPDIGLFEMHDVYSTLSTLEDQEIELENGAFIIIEETCAMTVIDVNQGSAAKVSDVNRIAAIEISRQCKLRNLSGAILVDFIGMNRKTERHQLTEVMEKLFHNHPSGAQVHGFTRLGIIEITRKRRSTTYAEKMKVFLSK